MEKSKTPKLIVAKDPDIEFAIFLEEQRDFERAYQIEEAANAFLDAYSAWLKDTHDRPMNPARSGGIKAQLIVCAAYLSSLDPEFRGPSFLRRYYEVAD